MNTPTDWRLVGELTFATVPAILREFNQKMSEQIPYVVDLGGVHYSDSSGIALLVEFTKRCQPFRLRFRHVSPQIRNIAMVNGVAELLADTSANHETMNA